MAATGSDQSNPNENESLDHDSRDDSRKDAIALKYLELARNEILERIKIGYQILTAYAAGIGAIAVWAYPAVPAGNNGAGNAALKGVPVGVIVAFLAVVASWIIYHNEYVVNALAEYQSEALAEHFVRVLPAVPMWERSPQLVTADDPTHASGDSLMVGTLVVCPAIVALFVQWSQQTQHNRWSCGWLMVGALLTLVSMALWIRTVKGRQNLRRKLANCGDKKNPSCK